MMNDLLDYLQIESKLFYDGIGGKTYMNGNREIGLDPFGVVFAREFREDGWQAMYCYSTGAIEVAPEYAEHIKEWFTESTGPLADIMNKMFKERETQ